MIYQASVWLATPITPPTVTLPFTIPTLGASLLLLIALSAAYLLARDAKKGILFEIGAIVSLLLTVVLARLTAGVASFEGVTAGFLAVLPVGILLLGLAFVADGGALKRLVGVVLIISYGLGAFHLAGVF